MLPYRLTLMSSCGLWLILAAACSDEKVRFDDGVAEEPSGALSGTSGDVTSADPGSSPGTTTDPADTTVSMGSIALPQSVTMTATGTVLCGDAPCQCNNGVDDDGDG